MQTAIRAALVGCLAGAALGGLLEAEYGLLGRIPVFARALHPQPEVVMPSADPEAATPPHLKLATYHGQEISNQVPVERLVLPPELRRGLKDLQAEEIALRDRTLGLKTMEEVEAAKKEYFLLQDKRQLVQNFILQNRAHLNEPSILQEFIVERFGPEFPVILEAEAYNQLVSNYTGAFGAGVEVTDLTGQIIESLRQEIAGDLPSRIR